MENSKNIDALIVQMVGKNAFENFMEVEKDFGKLCIAVKYLVTQIPMAGRMEPEEGTSHAEEVLKATVEILKGKK